MWFKTYYDINLCTMAIPDIGKLDLSDSDTEDLFASPSRASKPTQKSTKQTELAPRKEESKYDAEQAREASLQRELESVRSINDVIEGVVNSLDCAKGNMDVRSTPSHKEFVLIGHQDCFAHSVVRVYASKYMDSHSITNGT